ncbi:MAG: hypothetical protein H6650_22410, partial [Ardenticatenales bacterium]|nr:hypothetical protein [Ardenticatenales bacterium]
ELENTENGNERRDLLIVLKEIGEPSLETLYTYFSESKMPEVFDVLFTIFKIGIPASKVLAWALEYPEAVVGEEIMHRVSFDEPSDTWMENIDFVRTFASAIIDELVIRNPNRPNRFDDITTANALRTTIKRSSQLRDTIMQRLCAIVFDKDAEARNRAERVAVRLDRDDFLQRIRASYDEHPDIIDAILFRLGEGIATPSQRHSLVDYTERLQRLEDRSLVRWDQMTGQIKWSIILRNILTSVFFVACLALVGIGLWLLVTSDELGYRVSGGILSASTTLVGMVTQFWKASVDDIRGSLNQQAALEATFIGFMTRTGQIRLLFEQSYADGELESERIELLQRMVADAQAQTAEELARARIEFPQTNSGG